MELYLFKNRMELHRRKSLNGQTWTNFVTNMMFSFRMASYAHLKKWVLISVFLFCSLFCTLLLVQQFCLFILSNHPTQVLLAVPWIQIIILCSFQSVYTGLLVLFF